MAVTNVWAGGTTQDSAWVVTKVTTTDAVEVEVATNPGFTGSTIYGPVTPSAELIARVELTSLASATRYHYRVIHNAVPDASFPGQFVTLPVAGQPASYVVGAASCAGAGADVPGTGAVLAASRLSNHFVFDNIRERAVAEDWLLFFHMGDIHYYDLGSNNFGIVGGGSLTNYRRAVDDVLLQPRQHQLYRNVALEHEKDDHDWGRNDEDGTNPNAANALQVWRERFPYHPDDMGSADPAGPSYRAKLIGRVLWVVWDTRSQSSAGSDADTPAKTMLGSAQRTWFANLLATTTAEALVVVNTRQWEHPTGNDTWAAYTFDRTEVLEILETPGINGQNWLDRMAIIQGDAHSVGIASANAFGGFPVYQFAAMDATVGGAQAWKNLGSFSNHGQYGTIEVDDDGSTITITGTGWHVPTEGAAAQQLVSHSFQVETADPGPGPGPEPEPEPIPPVAVAQIRTRVTWLSCDLASGQIIGELQDITGNVERLIGEIKSAGLTLPIPLAGPASHDIAFIEQATAPARTLLVAVVNDVPTWGGIPMGPIESGSDAVITIPTVTVEGYLDRRVVRDHEWVQQDEASVIAAGLLGDAGDIPGVGVGIGLVIDAPPTGTLRDRTYRLTDRKTVYSALRELMAVQNGPEWMIDLDWADQTHRAVTKIARVRKRLGVADENPVSVFQTTAHSVFSSQGSSEARYKHRHDWSSGRGATYVVAYSSGEGDDQPSSAPFLAVDLLESGFPIYEEHFQPSTDISNVSTLNEHAAAALARRRDGWQAYHIEARWDAYPRYGVDWKLGDDVAWRLIGHRHPDGIVGQGRVIGFTLDMGRQIMVPILHEEDEE